MSRALDTDWTTHIDDKGPHYNPVRLLVDVTISRDTFGRMADAETSAAKVLTDAVDQLNNEFDCAHSVKVLPFADMEDDSLYGPNESRASWGESICELIEAMTGTERESAFTDGVSYLLHAELHRMSLADPNFDAKRAAHIARQLVESALESFAGDREDGPYACGDDGLYPDEEE